MSDLATAVVRRRIRSVEFGMYTDEEVRARSVLEITSPLTYGPLNTPLPNGLYDPHLGPTEKHGGSCITCGNPQNFCPGHCGHIELCVPVYNPLVFPKLVQLMRCKCFFCHDFRMGKVDCKTFAAKIALIEHGRCIDALELDGKLKGISTQYTSGASPEDAEQYLSKLLDKYTKTKSKVVLTSHERTIQREIIKEFISECLGKKKCSNCNACSPKVRQDAHNKIFQSPLNQKEKMINLAEGKTLKAALANEDKDLNGYDSDDSEVDPAGEDITGGDLFNADQNKGNVGQSKENDKYLHVLEVEAQLKHTWARQPYLCSRIFAFSHCSKKSLTKGYSAFFIRAVCVPPSRFRPPMILGTLVAEHSQNSNLTKILELNQRIRTIFAAITQLSEEGGDDGDSDTDPEDQRMERENLHQKSISVWIDLQLNVNTFYDSTKSTSDKAPNGIRQLLEKKEGIFRKNIMGKRVNFACRSVISPDPYIGTNEIGIPVKFAKKLTYPTPVNSLNVEEMRKLVVRGPSEYPGAVWVDELATGRRFDLTKMSQLKREAVAARLLSARGQTRVGRQLRNGDMMLLNRQPTLHKPGIMAHTVRILHNPTQQTIRMHYANCNTYNADFDGDEMNAHFPQNDIARAESKCILNTDLQYIVPTDGSPLRGLIQDHVDSGVKLTKLDTFLEKWEYQQLLFAALASLPGLEVIRSDSSIEMMPPAIRKPKELWTGKQVITTLLHHLRRGNDRDDADQSSNRYKILPGINIERKTKTPAFAFGEEYNEHKVLVRDGELLRGVLDKAAFGSTDFSLVHAVYEAYGPSKAGLLLNAFGRLFTAYLQYFSGHSCRMEDLVLTSQADEKRKELVKQSYNVGSQAAKAWADSEGGKTEISEEEINKPLTPYEAAATGKKISQLLSGKEGPRNAAHLDSFMQGKMNPLASKIIKACLPNGLAVPFPANTFGLMVTTGAKGSTVNQSQVSCSLGQQALEGRRVPRMPSGRTLPSFAPYDPNPRADGFISDRFLTGVRPQEYYFHCMAGREGLVDTAVKTSRSGYLQRCLVKHLEELKVCYDSTVRDAEGGVVQFLYGEDGIDPMKAAYLDCSSTTLDFIARNKTALERKFKALPNCSITIASEDARRANQLANNDPQHLMKVGDLVLARKLRFGNTWQRGALIQGWHQATVMKVHTDRSLDLKYHKDGSKVKHVHIEVEFSGCGGRKTKAISSTVTLVKPTAPDPILSDINRENGPHRIGSSGVCVSERVAQETSNALKNDSRLREALTRTGLTQAEFEKIVAAKYGSALCDPGEAVGCIAAQSVGEPSTQMTLNTFHLAGSGANVTLGIPRLREIIMTASRNLKTPTMSIPVDKSLTDKQTARLARFFKKVTLLELIASKSGITVRETLEQSPEGAWERAYYVTIKLHPAERINEAFGLKLEDTAAVVAQTFIPSLTKAMKKEFAKASIDGKTSSFQVEAGYDDTPVTESSGDAESEIKKAKNRQKESEEYEVEEFDEEDGVKASRLSHRKEMASYEMDDEEKQLAKEFAKEDNDDHLYDIDSDDEEEEAEKANIVNYDSVKANKKDNTISLLPLRVDPTAQPLLMIGLIEQVAAVTVVRSHKGIDEAYINDEDGRGKCLQTAGCNFEVLWNLENVDHNRLISNDIWAICCAYGVEAARKSIGDQIRGVFAVYGISVDPRHLSLISDSMTFDGGFKPMNRIGMNNSSSGFLKMSFETTATFLVDAALNNHTETLMSPSANIVVGNPIKHGTGAFECIVKA